MSRAGGLLVWLDACCRELVTVLALDEIFCHHRPILVGVEPHADVTRGMKVRPVGYTEKLRAGR